MNPDTNQLEALKEIFETQQPIRDSLNLLGLDLKPHLLRPDGSEVPKHWAILRVGELVVIKDYTFKIVYMNDGTIILEPVGPIEVGNSLAADLITK